MTRPGESVEGITVPRGDPGALRGAAAQLQGVGAQLEASAGQIGGLPSLMGSWAGPGSSAFAQLTGQESTTMGASAATVTLAALSVGSAAEALEDAQAKARRAIARAERARDEIDQAREAIREAEEAQGVARGRMLLAAAAREAAELRMLAAVVDMVAGDGSAAAAAAAADAEYREAERDLQEAERRERRARERLEEAEQDLLRARADGREAADDAELTATGLQVTMSTLPAAALAMPGAPAREHVAAAAGIPRPQPRDVPISERQPPESWPGFLKSWYKVGRGTATAIDGTIGLGRQAIENPERIPGALGDIGSRAYHDPLGTGSTLIGYDELASGRYEDWFGQMGVGALGGGLGTVPARASRLNRVVGSPRVQPLGRRPAPINSGRFAGRRVDFGREDLGARSGTTPARLDPAVREALAKEYPRGVRFTRAGYPVLTPYAIERVHVDGMNGDYRHDAELADRAAGIEGRRPGDHVWHHVENGRTMELVPKDLHGNLRHTGGVAAIPDQTGLVAPGGVFTPFERGAAGAGGAGGMLTGPAAAEASTP